MSDVWHSTSLFVKSPLYKALFHLKVFLLNTSGFIFIQTCKWGQYFPWLPSRILGKGLVVDERCQTTLFLFICFLDTAIIRRPPSLSIVETKYRIFYLLAFFSNLAIDSSVDLIFYTIVNCFSFVGAFEVIVTIGEKSESKSSSNFTSALSILIGIHFPPCAYNRSL